MIKLDKKHSGVFAAGVLFGTAGIKLLSSKDAKKVYTNCTAAVLRAKDCVMKIVSKVQESFPYSTGLYSAVITDSPSSISSFHK